MRRDLIRKDRSKGATAAIALPVGRVVARSRPGEGPA